MYVPSARACTHAGTASCTDILIVDIVLVHADPRQDQRRNNQRRTPHITPAPAAPPRYTASAAAIIWSAVNRRRIRCSVVAAITAPSPSEPFKMPYPSGPCFRILPCHHRQQRPDRRDEKRKRKRPHKRSLQIRRITHIAQPRTNRRRNPLRRQRRLEQRNALPVHQHPDHARKRQRVQRKNRSRPSIHVRLNAATINPPSAGPTARARLLLAAFKLTVSGISSRGTSSGTIACHAGLFIADPIFSRNVNASSAHGDTYPKTSAPPASPPTPASSSARRSAACAGQRYPP